MILASHSTTKHFGKCLHELNGFCMKISHREGCPSPANKGPCRCFYMDKDGVAPCTGKGPENGCKGHVYLCTSDEKESCLDFKRWDYSSN